MLELHKATGGYHNTVVIRDANLKVNSNEIVSLLGRNGVGKTTLIKYILGLIDAVEGEVRIDGIRLPNSTAKRVKAGIGYVPQGRFVFPRLNVKENIAAAAIACGHSKAEAIDSSFSEFPILKEKADNLAGSLSGGQQQILAIARALATKPKFLILDEPTEGVQPSIIDEIAGLLIKLNETKNLAILVAEQDLDFCLSISNKAYIMDKGTIAQQTTKDELLENKELLQELLGV